MTTPWKVLILALVAYSIWMTLAVTDLANSAFEQAWDAEFHEVKEFSDTVWGAKKIGEIHTGMALIGLVAGVALVIDFASRRRAR